LGFKFSSEFNASGGLDKLVLFGFRSD